MTDEADIVAEFLAQDPRLMNDEERDRFAVATGRTREEADRRIAELGQNWEGLGDGISPQERERAAEILAGWRKGQS